MFRLALDPPLRPQPADAVLEDVRVLVQHQGQERLHPLRPSGAQVDRVAGAEAERVLESDCAVRVNVDRDGSLGDDAEVALALGNRAAVGLQHQRLVYASLNGGGDNQGDAGIVREGRLINRCCHVRGAVAVLPRGGIRPRAGVERQRESDQQQDEPSTHR